MMKHFLILLSFFAMSWCLKAETEKHLSLMSAGNALFSKGQWNEALYTSVKEMTGEVKAFEAYLDLYQKGEKQFFNRIEKDYKTFSKGVEKGETTKLK